MFEQILRNEKPYLLPKRLNRSKNIQCQGNVLRSGLCHKQHRVNTLSLYCCEQKLNQTNSILPFHLEEFWTLGGERSELIVLNRNERKPKNLQMSCVHWCLQLLSVLLQLPHPNGSVLGWRGCTLQGMKMTSWVYFARSYCRTLEKTQLKKSTNLQQIWIRASM